MIGTLGEIIRKGDASKRLGDLLSTQAGQDLRGGLRCTTSTYEVSCEVVVKIGDFEEFERQLTYLDKLPKEVRDLFPKVVSISKEKSGEGLMILEKLDGQSLHDHLFDVYVTLEEKKQSVERALSALSRLHQYIPSNPLRFTRDPSNYWRSTLERIKKGIVFSNTRILENLEAFFLEGLVSEEKSASLLHGDAQAGNIIVTSNSRLPIRFIDPLGGSGMAYGDSLYDLSRMFHWIDIVGLCFEHENNVAPVYLRKQDLYFLSHQVLIDILMNDLVLRGLSPSECRWFWLYGMFHLSGKLSNFKSAFSQSLIVSRIEYYASQFKRGTLEVSAL